jgi:predicted CXXCH cytochrome family protein
MRPCLRSVALACAFFAAACLPAVAAHSGGVGNCKDCHLTHAEVGVAYVPGMLRGANATDVCLRCHDTGAGNSWGVPMTNPGPQYGAGAFKFLTDDNLQDLPGGPATPGERAGHNVVSVAKGTIADLTNATAPGGSYPASQLQCTSCHDPHGTRGHFRLLYGSDSPPSKAGGYLFSFTAPAPTGKGIDVEGTPESMSNHTAYQSGVSTWCGNCHGAYEHSLGSVVYQHPVDVPLPATMITTYNQYAGTGFIDATGLQPYQPVVPLEDPGFGIAYQGQAGPNSRVMCLTCHRAHASSGPRAGRWDFNIRTWADEGLLSNTFRIPNPYVSTAGNAQKQLCEKCHGGSVAVTPLAAPRTIRPVR